MVYATVEVADRDASNGAPGARAISTSMTGQEETMAAALAWLSATVGVVERTGGKVTSATIIHRDQESES